MRATGTVILAVAMLLLGFLGGTWYSDRERVEPKQQTIEQLIDQVKQQADRLDALREALRKANNGS